MTTLDDATARDWAREDPDAFFDWLEEYAPNTAPIMFRLFAHHAARMDLGSVDYPEAASPENGEQ